MPEGCARYQSDEGDETARVQERATEESRQEERSGDRAAAHLANARAGHDHPMISQLVEAPMRPICVRGADQHEKGKQQRDAHLVQRLLEPPRTPPRTTLKPRIPRTPRGCRWLGRHRGHRHHGRSVEDPEHAAERARRRRRASASKPSTPRRRTSRRVASRQTGPRYWRDLVK